MAQRQDPAEDTVTCIFLSCHTHTQHLSAHCGGACTHTHMHAGKR